MTLISHNPRKFLVPYSIEDGSYVFNDYTFYPQRTVDEYLAILKLEIFYVEQRKLKQWAALWDSKATALLPLRARRLVSRAARLLGDEAYNEAAGRKCYVNGMRVLPQFSRPSGCEESWNYFRLEGAKHELVYARQAGGYTVELFEDRRLRMMRDGVRLSCQKYGGRKTVDKLIAEVGADKLIAEVGADKLIAEVGDV